VIEAPGDYEIVEGEFFQSDPPTVIQGVPSPKFFFGFTPPSYMVINSATGIVYWPETIAGEYNVVIRAVNEFSSHSDSFKLSVKRSYNCTASTRYSLFRC
jgi:hypothetical protein